MFLKYVFLEIAKLFRFTMLWFSCFTFFLFINTFCYNKINYKIETKLQKMIGTKFQFCGSSLMHFVIKYLQLHTNRQNGQLIFSLLTDLFFPALFITRYHSLSPTNHLSTQNGSFSIRYSFFTTSNRLKIQAGNLLRLFYPVVASKFELSL